MQKHDNKVAMQIQNDKPEWLKNMKKFGDKNKIVMFRFRTFAGPTFSRV